MALVATVGAKTANSYASVAEAGAYFADHPLTATWTAKTTAQKEQLLIQATRDIDTETLSGFKYNDTIDTDGLPIQALHFPRADDVSSTGVLYIPIAVKKACYEQTIELARTGTTATRLTLQAQGVVEAQVGDVLEKYRDGGISTSALRSAPRNMLMRAGFIEFSGAWA
ncbi:MAG: DnaT-like ssDNA-binding protein [Tepidisphaeraceae bacterium]